MTITLTPEVEREVQAKADRRGVPPEQIAMQAMITGLRGRRVPQTLANLPQRPLPPGKTLRDLFEELWRDHPSTETDEEVQRYLDELS